MIDRVHSASCIAHIPAVAASTAVALNCEWRSDHENTLNIPARLLPAGAAMLPRSAETVPVIKI